MAKRADDEDAKERIKRHESIADTSLEHLVRRSNARANGER